MYDGITASDFLEVLTPPEQARAALLLLDDGPDTFDGYDQLFFINLTDQPIAAPRLSVGGGGDIGLLHGGFSTSTLFGGNGPVELGQLDVLQVYTTLVPEGAVDFRASLHVPRTELR